MRNVSIGELIQAAFGVEARFLSAPDWLSKSPDFDIRATIPNDASARQVPEMIQSLLEQRFKLAFHREHQERQAYALLVDKGGARFPKSTGIDDSMPGGGFAGVSAVSDEPGGRVWTSPNKSAMRITPLAGGGARWNLTGMSVPELAYILNTLDGLDIMDMTQIKGTYDFTFTASPEDVNELSTNTAAATRSTTPSTRESLQRLGLRLENRKVTVDVLVIDRLEKTPTEN